MLSILQATCLISNFLSIPTVGPSIQWVTQRWDQADATKRAAGADQPPTLYPPHYNQPTSASATQFFHLIHYLDSMKRLDDTGKRIFVAKRSK